MQCSLRQSCKTKHIGMLWGKISSSIEDYYVLKGCNWRDVCVLDTSVLYERWNCRTEWCIANLTFFSISSLAPNAVLDNVNSIQNFKHKKHAHHQDGSSFVDIQKKEKRDRIRPKVEWGSWGMLSWMIQLSRLAACTKSTLPVSVFVSITIWNSSDKI